MAQMDKTTIFSKTADGEEAVKQRTRLVQRNLRNILIMVDGESSVADLAERFGDMAVVENALAELSAMGFIVGTELVLALPSSTAAAEPSANDEPLLSAAEPEELISEDIAAPPAPGTPEAAPASPPVVAAPPPVIEEIFFESPEYFSDPAPARPATPPAADMRHFEGKFATKDSGFSLIETLKGVWSPKTTRSRSDFYEAQDADVRRVKIKPIRRAAKRLYISWPLLTVMILGGSVSVLALIALLFPYDNYLPDIERRASEALNDPVKIGKISFSFLPRPNITLRGVVIGKERFLSADTVRVLPNFLSLLTDKKVLRELDIDHVILKYQGLNRVAQWRSGPNAEVHRIHVGGLSLDLGDVVLDGMGGEVGLNASGALEKIELRNADASFKLNLTPKGQAFKFDAVGNVWKMPVPPGLTFDYVEAQGELSATRLDLSKLDGKLYGGLLLGKATVDWSRGAVLTGDMEMKRIDLAKLMPNLNPDLEVEGELSGKTRFDSKTERLARLGDGLHLDGTVDIRRGAVKRFDLVEVVRGARGESAHGGLTRFEQLTGNLLLDQRGWKLSSLRATSGLMKAGGSVSMNAERRLSGTFDVELKGSANVVRSQLAVAGTLKEPLLSPSRGAKR